MKGIDEYILAAFLLLLLLLLGFEGSSQSLPGRSVPAKTGQAAICVSAHPALSFHTHSLQD